jgi:hypothetical protein
MSMSKGGFHRARIRPGQPSIRWKSTQGEALEDEKLESGEVSGPATSRFSRVAKAVAPVAKIAVKATPHGQMSAAILNRVMQDGKARKEVARVVRDDPKANDAAKKLREHAAQVKSDRAKQGPKPGKGDELMVPYEGKPVVRPNPTTTVTETSKAAKGFVSQLIDRGSG